MFTSQNFVDFLLRLGAIKVTYRISKNLKTFKVTHILNLEREYSYKLNRIKSL